MTSYLLKRFLRGILSVMLAAGAVMLLLYSLLDRNRIFADDPSYSRLKLNAKQQYKMQQWEKYGYLDYESYADHLKRLLEEGAIDAALYAEVVELGKTAEEDSQRTAEFVSAFTAFYESKGYTVERYSGVTLTGSDKYREGGRPLLYAYRDIPLTGRVLRFFRGIFSFDSTRYVKEEIEDRGLVFTLYDPVYGGEVFSPAIMGNGTRHKYLLYFDTHFPFMHQNFLTVHLGASSSLSRDEDVFDVLTKPQGGYKERMITYPTGLTELSADDLHSATYLAGSLEAGTEVIRARFTDDYTQVTTYKSGLSRIGYSFVIGFFALIIAYFTAVPLGIAMARKKAGLVDKLGTLYIVFMIAVPSLAYIFLFQSIGRALGLPTTFDSVSPTPAAYLLPTVSLALPMIASLMKWLRRYTLDQMSADYVRFARASGLSEGEVFSKHIVKNAIIPILHGLPAAFLGALVGAIITERVYVVPGAGNLLTESIASYDNGVTVGLTVFYALLSVLSLILGDILMALADPRISFSQKAR